MTAVMAVIETLNCHEAIAWLQTLSVLLGFFSEVLKIADGRISGFSECRLLAPLQDFSRTHSLHDPVTDGGGLSAVNQDVGNIAGDLQPSIRRGFCLAQISRRNQAQSLFPNQRALYGTANGCS